MSTDTSTKTISEMLVDAPDTTLMLLSRFERDIASLSDYCTPLEQRQHVERIYYAVRSHLMIGCRWSHEQASAMASSYRTMLNLRLKKPTYYNPALRPRQPEVPH